MKRKLLMVAFALLFSVSVISNSQEIRKKDLKIVEKVYYLKDSDTPFTGKVSEGKDRLYYLNGKQDGKWISFYKNGNIKSIINWKDGKLNGKYIIYENNGMKVLLAAPTGRAAKRMTESTGREAKTIHRLLEMGVSDDENSFFGKGEGEPLEGDVIIIDEASMIDIMLMNSLLKAIKLGTRVIIVGDVDQCATRF